MWGQPPGWQYADNSQDLPVHQPRREEQQKTWQKTSGLRLRNFGKKQKIPSPLQGSNTELSGATCYVQQPLAWVKNVKFTRKTWFSICPIWSSVIKFEPSSTDNMYDTETFFWEAVNDGRLKVKCGVGHEAGGESVSHLQDDSSANLSKIFFYHFYWNHRAIDLGAWEEVSHQEVAACFSQFAGFFTCSKCRRRHWSEYWELLTFECYNRGH